MPFSIVSQIPEPVIPHTVLSFVVYSQDYTGCNAFERRGVSEQSKPPPTCSFLIQSVLTYQIQILGEDEVAQGKVKIKENGLRPDHPEKEGVMVKLSDLVPEVKARIQRKAEVESLAIEAEGFRVVGGSKNQSQDAVPESGKPAEDTPLSQDVLGAVPAS